MKSCWMTVLFEEEVCIFQCFWSNIFLLNKKFNPYTLDLLAGPTRREFSGSFIPNIYTNVKVEGPSFPTFRASQLKNKTTYHAERACSNACQRNPRRLRRGDGNSLLFPKVNPNLPKRNP